MNFASKINDINRCFVCGCETADENCCRIAGLAGRHKLIVPKPCNYHMHPVSSFDRDERQFHTRRHRSVFAKRLSARTEGIIHFGKIKCAWRWAVGLQRERAHDGQETCPEYSIGTGGYNGSGYREVQAMKVHHGCAADSYHCFSLDIVDSANSPNVLLALVVLLLYPKTFL